MKPDLKFETKSHSKCIKVQNIARDMIMKKIIVCSLLLCAAMFPFNCTAEQPAVGITAEKSYAVLNNGRDLIRIERTETIHDSPEGLDSISSRGCPPFCVSPLRIADSVETVAELEVIEFMESTYLSGEGVIVDVRAPDWYAKSTIPGSINVPFTLFEQPTDDIELQQLLGRLGARVRGDVGAVVRALEKLGMFDGEYKTDRWDFSAARDVLLWCNDPVCEEAPRAIHALVSLGYPPEKLFYYRGGMRMWQSLGLTTIVPGSQSTFASK